MKTKTTAGPIETLLTNARKLLITKGWTQKSFARTKKNVQCSFTDNVAGKFCAVGALYRLDRTVSNVNTAVKLLCDVVGEPAIKKVEYSFTGWNDAKNRTKKQVIKAYDKAIKLAKKQAL